MYVNVPLFLFPDVVSTELGPMGASESVISKLQQQPTIDQVTTVSERKEDTDPILERIQALKIATPLLSSQPSSEGSLTDILVRKPSSSSNSTIPGSLNPNILLELFSTYREWQTEKAKKISQKQEEIENMIETADALTGKLLQRFNYSVSSIRTASRSLTGGGLPREKDWPDTWTGTWHNKLLYLDRDWMNSALTSMVESVVVGEFGRSVEDVLLLHHRCMGHSSLSILSRLYPSMHGKENKEKLVWCL
ncbi:uncharacterized protein LOC110037937 isoform X1 [Phalaenopsis equestris]|uniref:uncharacterized protein LOC110037937 isoform X1 n=1 Tax=Phalaenopsis equestris TaxID=78828 RepID=UPI0009E498CE|nr:uncharacterized protein LOC110037937 isoform X1 [Phalaenopsis equestris]